MREEFIIDGDDDDCNNSAQSDLVRLAVYYPYLSAKRQADFNFSVNDKFAAIKNDQSFHKRGGSNALES